MTKQKSVAVLDETSSTSSAIATLAARMGVEATGMFLKSLRDVAFKTPNVTNEQLMALVVVANQYQLNPFTRELYAFPDRNTGGIVPIVSVDGWFRIINEHPQFDGFEYNEDMTDSGETYGVCTIYRKDRKHPTVVREYLNEVKRNTDPWKQHTHRMLRHKTIIQTARVAFGFAGIYDQDDAERMLQTQRVVTVTNAQSGAERVAQLLQSSSTELDAAPEIDDSADIPIVEPAAAEKPAAASKRAPQMTPDDELPL